MTVVDGVGWYPGEVHTSAHRDDSGAYRLWVHDGQPADRMVIAAVRRILADEGVDLGGLVPVDG